MTVKHLFSKIILPLIAGTYKTSDLDGMPTQVSPPGDPMIRYDGDEDSVLGSRTGTEITFRNLTFYQTGNMDSESAVIVVHDLFGLRNRVMYIADKLGDGGFRVFAPDFFYGQPYEPDNFPPPEFAYEVDDLFGPDNGTWTRDVQPAMVKLLQYLNGTVNYLGVLGISWGGKMAVYAAADPVLNINAAALVHPKRLVVEDFGSINCPMIILHARNQIDMGPYLSLLKDNGARSEHFRFTDVEFGFAGARSDFTNIRIKQSVDDAIRLSGTFFARNLATSTTDTDEDGEIIFGSPFGRKSSRKSS